MKKKILSIISLFLVIALMGGFLAFFFSRVNVVVPPKKSNSENSSSMNGQWVLVTDINMLNKNSKIIIAAKDYDFAMGVQNENNRAAVSIEKNGNTLTINDEVQPIVLDWWSVITDTTTDTIVYQTNFYLGDGLYLYAPSSSQNHLKTKYSLTESSFFSISISSDGTASIVADAVEHNTLRFNSTSSLFSCYPSTNTMKDVCIYVYTEN